MTDETAERNDQVRPAPRSVPLSGEDRRLLAALLDELLADTKDGRPTPQPRGAEPQRVG
jgi:hypothetical protein